MMMSAYLENVKQIVDNLATAGEPLEDQTVTHFVVNGLGPDFEPFAHTITDQVEPVTFDTLTNLLLTQEQRLQLHAQLQNFDNSSRLSLNVVVRGSRGGGRGGCGRASQGRDQTNQNGHGYGRSQADRGDSSNRPLYHICNKRGHSAIQCHNRFNLSYQPSPTPQGHSVQVDNHSDTA
ncbi:hypothetical protein H6P81_010008 [Aristolochia fimbriata]|uniref:Gag protein n=1 Tax=Aristolochia fimbriata TaxID=158543 RepID=A0AAV7EMQ1_ARIFI|nr:hypothetical protein H6P81_010008 [Aristolochia fimbriata]